MTTTIEQPGAVRPPPPTKKQASAIRVSPLLIEASRKNADEVFTLANTRRRGWATRSGRRGAQYWFERSGSGEAARVVVALWIAGCAIGW